MSAASMIATHMNAPYGNVVRAGDVAASLINGKLSASSKKANAILEALFVEVPPDLILKCASEVHAPLEMVNQLYHQTVEIAFMPSSAWENTVDFCA